MIQKSIRFEFLPGFFFKFQSIRNDWEYGRIYAHADVATTHLNILMNKIFFFFHA